jgi:2-hydroxy-3-oxopropionate reductase
MSETIGFIGLGIMGGPMALNLIQSGRSLVVYNRSRHKADAVLAAGAEWADTPRELAAASGEVIITMVGGSDDVEGVALGPGGLIEGASAGQTLIDMSTISPRRSIKIAERLSDRGVNMLDAPVTGSKVAAEGGTLTVMVGGAREVFDRVRPVFDPLAGKVAYMGKNGMGSYTKICNNIIGGSVLSVVSESLVLAAKVGLDPKLVCEVISSGLCRTNGMDIKAPTIMARDFSPHFAVKHMLKDLGIALEVARDEGTVVPMAAAAQQNFTAAMALGFGEDDFSSVVRVIEHIAGVEVKTVEGGK